MSTWHAIAIERLGAPDVLWPSVYGPAAGADPITANGLGTMDLTPTLFPLTDFAAQMERDLTGGSFSSIKIDLSDPDGTLANALGPFSATLGSSVRYFGPWVQILERWGGTNEALRFLGYVDESSIQWSEEDAKTQLTVIHASQLLKERLITDFPSLLRPWPSVPVGGIVSFTQSTADDLLHAAVSGYTPRTNAAAIEAAQWAVGKLSWEADVIKLTVYRNYSGETFITETNYPIPDPPAMAIIIGATTYPIAAIEWGDIEYENLLGSHTNGEAEIYAPVRISLLGSPNLTGILSLGTTVTWATPATQQTHYLLDGGSISAPVSGSDGPKFVKLNTVEQLAPGDVLTLTFTDATSGAPRTNTADLPVIIDLDGETGTAHLASALTQGYSNVSRVRRNSQDPVLFDGVAYAKALVAPFTLDTSAFSAAPSAWPILTWQPYDVATPSLQGLHNLQTTSQAGQLRLARRGPDSGTSTFPLAGVWTGAWSGTWTWQGLPTADATHQIFGDVLQWPGGTNAFTAPVIYIEGDLSGGSTTPPNGWRHGWRTWKVLSAISQNPESTWNGTAVQWAATTASGDIPARVVAFAASTATPGRYTRTSAGTWTFSAHTADATLDSSSTPTVTGAFPSGNVIALGMGIYASGDEQEALLGLVVTGTTHPFTDVTATVLSRAAGGNLTVRQSQQLWATGGAIPAGPWALGGGLVAQSWSETINGITYPHTVLHKLNGSTVITGDLKTLEVIPQTLQPLLLTGTAGSKVIGGWYALALETYVDQNFAASRRLRFLHLDETLKILNGDAEADPSSPNSSGAYFTRGELVASLVPDGAIIAKLVRTSNVADDMAGVVGGRIFTVGHALPTTIERLKIGATAPKGNTISVAHSGDGMTVADFLEKFATSQMASAVPSADGSMALVSRSGGAQRLRTFGAQQVSVQASERGRRTTTQTWQGYIRKVRVTYTDVLANTSASVEVTASFSGGRILEMDVSDLVTGPTMASAIGRASSYWFGQPAPILGETWADNTGGLSDDMAPAWWATWRIGDCIFLDAFTTPVPTKAYKLLKMQPGLEARTVNVELRQQPFLITPGA